MHIGRWILATAAALAAAAPAWAGGDGLATRVDQVPWLRLAGKLGTFDATPAWRASLVTTETSGLKLRSLTLLGDLYAGSGSAGLQATPPSGFRATSGLLIGGRNQPWSAAPLAPLGNASAGDRRPYGTSALPYTSAEAAADNATVPYLGFGYSGLSAKSGWSFSADLGVMSLNPGSAVRLGRAVGNGSQGLDDLVHDMRLAPVLQLGVSYSF